MSGAGRVTVVGHRNNSLRSLGNEAHRSKWLCGLEVAGELESKPHRARGPVLLSAESGLVPQLERPSSEMEPRVLHPERGAFCIGGGVSLQTGFHCQTQALLCVPVTGVGL